MDEETPKCFYQASCLSGRRNCLTLPSTMPYYQYYHVALDRPLGIAWIDLDSHTIAPLPTSPTGPIQDSHLKATPWVGYSAPLALPSLMTHLLNPASAVPHLGPTWGSKWSKWHQWGHNWRRYQWNGEKELQDTIEVNIKYKEFLGPLTSPLRQTMLAYSSNIIKPSIIPCFHMFPAYV